MKAHQLPNLRGLLGNANRLKIELTKAINAGATYAKRGVGYSPASDAIKELLDAAIVLNRSWTRADSIAMLPATDTLAALETQQLAVTATFPDAGTEDVTADTRCVYTTSDATKATVSASGLVTAVATGAATITATFQGRTDTTAITVS